ASTLNLEKALLLEHLDRRADSLKIVDSLPDDAGDEFGEDYAATLRILRMRLWDWSLSGRLDDKKP
ncbi:MAG: hypothetical protein ACI8UO_006286, partial [Verrucomicrobiales bacterium]